MSVCYACDRSVKASERIICSAATCLQVYHYLCVNLTTKPKSNKDWKCPVCIVKLPKGDNSNTPIKSQSDDGELEQGKDRKLVSTRNTTKPEDAGVDPNFMEALRDSVLSAIRNELPLLLREIISDELSPIKKEIQELKRSLTFLHTETSDIRRGLEEVQEASTKQNKNYNDLELRVRELERDLARQQQWSRLQNLEIIGVPETSGEKTQDIVVMIAKYAGVELRPDEVEFAHRVQPLRAAAGRPRSIVLRLRHRLTKDKLLSAARKCRGITTRDIGIGGQTNNIYVNEHLTPNNKVLLKMSKDKAKEINYKYVWTKNCRIFVRRDEKSPPVPISTESDIKKIA